MAIETLKAARSHGNAARRDHHKYMVILMRPNVLMVGIGACGQPVPPHDHAAPFLLMLRNFWRRWWRSSAPERTSSGARAVSRASPTAATVSLGWRCAPPSGSGMIRSTMPSWLQVLGGQPHRLGRLRSLIVAAPEDRGTAFGGNDRVDRVLEHQHLVGDRERHGTARAALADDHADQRDRELQAGLDRARDRLGLAALLGADAGMGAGRVDQRHDRQAEALGEVHQAHRLAVAFGVRHAEVVAHPALGVGALLVADHDQRAAAEARETALDRAVVAEGAIARERRVVLEQLGRVVGEMRPLGMARDLRLLPGVELGVGLAQQLLGARLEARDLVGEVEVAAVGQMAQLLDLALELADRLLELQQWPLPPVSRRRRSGRPWRPAPRPGGSRRCRSAGRRGSRHPCPRRARQPSRRGCGAPSRPRQRAAP